MPKLIIDNIPLEVSEGVSILEAARQVGIVIPHFCWHPALGKAGACRVCAVKMLDGPVKGVQMSCMLPAQDGMVVSTTDSEAVALRRSVIEWLMINHPHDCPVCDEGGECQLQDYTIAGGHGIRRYDGRKRTHANQYLGDQIEHEMNRCIQCYRCVRFYQEYAGGTDFGVLGRSAMVYFGRQQDGPLESPFSGNLVDICPTGVFTDKTARFRARYWDYDMAPSVCPHCSLGCNITPMARYRELLKIVARRNDAVNGWFICDRGRFANSSINAPDRPRQPLIEGNAAAWDEALDALMLRVGEFIELHGSGSLAIIGSPRMSLEGNIMAAKLRALLEAGALCYFRDELDAGQAAKAVSQLNPANAASQEDVRKADLVAIVACDLPDEAPMMALAVRQAWRNGAQIYHIGNAPLNRAQKKLYKAESVNSLADITFSGAKRPVVICGIQHPDFPAIDAAVQCGAKLSFILDRPNAFGCALLARDNGAIPLSTALASGKLKGLIACEADLPTELPDGVTVLAAADWLATPLALRAEIFLPTASWIEMDGTFINNEGRAQRFEQVMQPGLPIKGLDPAGHPPRIHRTATQGGDVLPSWQILADIIERLGGERIQEPLSGQWAKLRELDPLGHGISMLEEKR